MSKNDQNNACIIPIYGSRAASVPVPKYQLPEEEMSPRLAYDLIDDQLMLDGNARLNLATFVTTWMEPEAEQLMAKTFNKNMIDKDEYPQTAEIEQRCVRILADLWHAPDPVQSIGCSATGSSEACMLAGMAMKWNWRKRRTEKGLPIDKPNLVMGINVQICWEKFCCYWDVEMKLAPMQPNDYTLTPEKMLALCDENTIGVVGILGSTFTGEYEPIQHLHDALVQLNEKTGWEIPLHVDGASGAMVAPFIQQDLLWDFRLPLVKSINTSGHKYGLVYPGVGWAIWRDKRDLPEELIFNVNYLGGSMPTFTLNFSRSGNQVVGQYYNFLRLGRDGFRRIHATSQKVARYLAKAICQLGPFEMLHDGRDLPVVAWRLKANAVTAYSLFDLSDRLRMWGWQVPAYTLPENLTDIVIMRIVVKEGMSLELADLLLDHMRQALLFFDQQADLTPEARSGFHH